MTNENKSDLHLSPTTFFRGFTKDARYEADRGSIPEILLDLDHLSNEIVRHYGEIDMEVRRPSLLTKNYWRT